jgi:hypothetical protein
MTPMQLRGAIEKLQRQLAELRRRRGSHATVLAGLLNAEPMFYDALEAARTRIEILRIDEQIAGESERVAALESQLPTQEDSALAERQAHHLRQQADTARAEFINEWTGLFSALEVAERAARSVASARERAATSIAQLTDLKRGHGIAVSIPALPEPSGAENAIATHVARLLRDVLEGVEPDATTDQYLRNARAAVASQPLPAAVV